MPSIENSLKDRGHGIILSQRQDTRKALPFLVGLFRWRRTRKHWNVKLFLDKQDVSLLDEPRAPQTHDGTSKCAVGNLQGAWETLKTCSFRLENDESIIRSMQVFQLLLNINFFLGSSRLWQRT